MKIVRDNMPFGSVGAGEYGTYFIGYARSPRRHRADAAEHVHRLPDGNYDRILDFSRAVTGGLFFVPPAPLLESLGDDEDAERARTDADHSPARRR